MSRSTRSALLAIFRQIVAHNRAGGWRKLKGGAGDKRFDRSGGAEARCTLMAVSERMRAVVYDRYGPPEVQRMDEVDRPEPAEDELLVRVHATSVTRTDAGLRSAEIFISRVVTSPLL